MFEGKEVNEAGNVECGIGSYVSFTSKEMTLLEYAPNLLVGTSLGN